MKKLIAMFAFIPMLAQAGVYLEPYLGYGFGDGDYGSYSVDKENGPAYGMRFGGSLLGLMAGYEYSIFKGDLDLKAGNTTISYESDVSMHGLFAGYQFPSVIPLLGKVWGTYYFAGETEITATGQDTTKADIDSGYALGLGLAPIPIPLPFLSLHFNLEYRHLDYKKDSDGDVLKTDAYIFSVSVPINI